MTHTPLDLRAMRERDAALRPDGAAWKCRQCDYCPSCRLLVACETHDGDTDILLLMAEIGLLRNELGRCAECGLSLDGDVSLTAHDDRLERHPACEMARTRP